FLIIVGNSIGGATALRVASNNSNIKLLSLSNPGGLDKRGILAPILMLFFRALPYGSGFTLLRLIPLRCTAG
ncbi:MAG: hypothetical protein ACOVNR_00135, partial [Chitinophagaceae bacterium]